jgi:DNA (cytosine-5)-methyltransferase 1
MLTSTIRVESSRDRVLTIGSLFSGIGGFDLGLERAGRMRVAWQCERDEFCRGVLAQHWPDVPCYPDITTLRGAEPVDIICGGFPCPVVSQAARGRNVAVSLWPEFARLIREVGPRYVIVENVEGLLSAGRGFGDVLGDLAESGFDATWRVLRASDFGAPHHRARVWLVGYPNADCEPDLSLDDEVAGMPQLRGAARAWPDPPSRLGMDDGLPGRMDRLHTLGNALVPAIAEFIGHRILAAYDARDRLAA